MDRVTDHEDGSGGPPDAAAGDAVTDVFEGLRAETQRLRTRLKSAGHRIDDLVAENLELRTALARARTRPLEHPHEVHASAPDPVEAVARDDQAASGAADEGLAPAPVAVRVRPAPVPGVRPEVDVQQWNPIGFVAHKVEHDAFAVVPSGEPGAGSTVDALAAIQEALPGRAVKVLDVAASDLDVQPRVREFRGMVDHPELHRDVSAHAERLVRFAAAGTPILSLGIPDGVKELLSPALVDALDAVSPPALDTLVTRERLSIELRRAALRDHAVGASRVPAVSILLPTRRPDFLAHALEQTNRQNYPALELVAVLHGDDFPSGIAEWLIEESRHPTVVVRVPGDRSLGRALNDGVAAAGGSLLVKMDDDDWYGNHHVQDLVCAHGYADAQLVGKAAEFLYLRTLDITIRRWANGAERASRDVAGATFLFDKSTLSSAGGWRDVPRAVDQRLLDDIQSAGGRIYRTHGFGFLVNRHGGHTWNPEPEYFIRQAGSQWRGLNLGAAGV